MDIQYDPKVDAVRIILRKNVKVEESEPSTSNPNVIIDFDENNNPVAIEILHLRHLSGGLDDYLKEISYKVAN